MRMKDYDGDEMRQGDSQGRKVWTGGTGTDRQETGKDRVQEAGGS